MQIGGDPDNPVSVHQTIEQIIVDPTDRGSKGV
jgi:hypothetical protein